jgi:hypothetical protein
MRQLRENSVTNQSPNSGMVGPAVHTQVNDFNSLQKGGDQKAALRPLSFLTRGHDHH